VGKRNWRVNRRSGPRVLGLVTAGLSPCSHDFWFRVPRAMREGGRERLCRILQPPPSVRITQNADFAEGKGGRGHVLPCVQTVESGGLPPLPAAKTADADTCLPQRPVTGARGIAQFPRLGISDQELLAPRLPPLYTRASCARHRPPPLSWRETDVPPRCAERSAARSQSASSRDASGAERRSPEELRAEARRGATRVCMECVPGKKGGPASR
jgi:hypothetical protein